MIEFHLDEYSGLSPYRQVVQQVRHALLLGQLRENDRLPTVKGLAAQLALNPNTVQKAYRELEYAGLVTGQAGVGTFIRATLAGSTPAEYGPLREELSRWLSAACDAGMGDEHIEALFSATLRAARQEKAT